MNVNPQIATLFAGKVDNLQNTDGTYVSRIARSSPYTPRLSFSEEAPPEEPLGPCTPPSGGGPLLHA